MKENAKLLHITIDGTEVEAPEGSSILDAATAAGIHIPHLCFLKEINEVSSCKVCVVEVEGVDHLVASCTTKLRDGMVVHTASPKVRAERKMNTQLLLSRHNSSCNVCVRSGNCQLQTVAREQGILNEIFTPEPAFEAWNNDFPLVRDSSKCIRCMRCVHVCARVQGCDIWEQKHIGENSGIGTKDGVPIELSDCTLCGQCITHCPTGALSERDDLEKVFAAIADPEITTVVQVAPAVRTAWMEQEGLSGPDAEGKMAAALKKLGFDHVLDTVFSADVTIMEEGSELLERLAKKAPDDHLPMFTSCCPGWVSYLTARHPELLGQLSTTKSPQQIFGALIKTYFAKQHGIDPAKLCSISIMPCVSKKREAAQPSMAASGHQDVDLVLTSREFLRFVKAREWNLKELTPIPFDSPIGDGTGAGVIFGVTGGVMEAALRTAYKLLSGTEAPDDAFRPVRDERLVRRSMHEVAGIRPAEFTIGDKVLRTCTISGLANAEAVIQAILHGEAEYDFVEVMACPGGCVGGGGQPIHEGEECAAFRGGQLYTLDKARTLRRSHENPQVIKVYEDYLKKPLGELSEELLHSDHINDGNYKKAVG